MNDRELLEFIAAQVGNLTKDLTEFKQETKEEFRALKNHVTKIDAQLTKIEITLETDINPKIEALFDGHKQNTKLLEEIHDEVAKHEEFIIKRVK
jgi:wobble nucleotide-excising tRNase